LSTQNKKIFGATKDCRHTVTPATQNSLEHSCNEGLGYILSQFDDEIWPRTISTKATQGRQSIINSREEALAYFKAANYFDCRISAFTYWRRSIVSDFAGIKNAIAPNLIMIDLDMDNFDCDEEQLKCSLQKTLKKIMELLNFKPTVILSGEGYHIYVPINTTIVLEDIKEFSNIEHVSTDFLRFAEWYLSSGKSDFAHNNSVSLNNCMLRIPGTYNSNNNAQVRIIKKWDYSRPDISLLIGSFCAYLKDRKIKEGKRINTQKQEASVKGDNIIVWIEKLLQTPIQDHRKYCIWRIFGPYLLNVRGMSYEQAFNIIREWLDRCSQQKRRLDFHPKSKIDEGLKGVAKKGYFPIGLDKLKTENDRFYSLLHDHGVIQSN
jgi:hypothetical protein